MKNIRMIVSSGPLKSIARQKLKGHWFEAAAIFLIVGIFGNAGQRLFTNNLNFKINSGTDFKSMFDMHGSILTFGIVLGVVTFFIGGAIAVGGMHYILNLLRDNNPKFSDILYGFKYFWRSFKQSFLFELVIVFPVIIIAIIAVIISVGLSQRVDTILLASIILFIIFTFAWLIYTIVISYALSFRYFQIADEHYEYMGAIDSFKVCSKAMKGNKAHLFGVELSFIGWLLLVVVPSAFIQTFTQDTSIAFIMQLLVMIPMSFIAAYLYATEGIYYRILTGELKIDVVDDSPLENLDMESDSLKESLNKKVDSVEENELTMEDPKFPPNIDSSPSKGIDFESSAKTGENNDSYEYSDKKNEKTDLNNK
ncbi:DUF975 family protein [Eubacteriales bacterium KG127]